MNRLLRWFLAHDPTTACTWEADDAYDRFAAELARINAAHDAEANLLVAVGRQAAADLAASQAECALLDQENMRLRDELTEAQIAAGTVRIPSLRVVRP